jgi:hypothetical protein
MPRQYLKQWRAAGRERSARQATSLDPSKRSDGELGSLGLSCGCEGIAQMLLFLFIERRLQNLSSRILECC